MLLTKRLRAGILLYALFMAAVFALFLQFYVGRVKASHRVRQALYHQTQASLMAEMTKDQATEGSGGFQFDHGSSSYHRKDEQLFVEVSLASGQSYRYDFLVQPKPEDYDKEVKKDGKPEQDDIVNFQEPEPDSSEISDLSLSDGSSADNKNP